jgi:hypothetical protein
MKKNHHPVSEPRRPGKPNIQRVKRGMLRDIALMVGADMKEVDRKVLASSVRNREIRQAALQILCATLASQAEYERIEHVVDAAYSTARTFVARGEELR